jgi:hypothetical protein
MNAKTLDAFLHRATSLGLALVVTLGMLGSIDLLARAPLAEEPAAQQVAAGDNLACPRG